MVDLLVEPSVGGRPGLSEPWTNTPDEVVDLLDSSAEVGLSSAVAAQRLASDGPNELAKEKGKTIWQRLWEQLKNPMVLVLLAAAIISTVVAYLAHGEIHEYIEAGIILAVVILNCAMGVYQEAKADSAIEALQKMSASEAKVKRDGTVIKLPSSQLVVGDLVLLEAGDSVPADVRLLHAASLRTEESALTGESLPVEKSIDPLPGEDGPVTLGDRRNMAYMGTSVVYGRGEAVVVATGMKTEMGKIAGLLAAAEATETPLQRRMSKLSKTLSFLVLGICLVVFAVQILRTDAALRWDLGHTIMPSFMLAISLAVAAIPEGLAAVVTIVLSMGVTKMAKRHAIVRNLTSVETLGSAQVICSDKTGTITQNKMTVVDSFSDDNASLARGMALASDSQLAPDGNIVGDPTENALVAYALEQNMNKQELDQQFPRVGEAPFDSDRKMMSTLHDNGITGDVEDVIQYTKGAPDEVLLKCKWIMDEGERRPITQADIDEIHEANAAFADRALRVLALATRDWAQLPESHQITPEYLEDDLTFVGLVAEMDPVRPEVKDAVQTAAKSGIRVVMITGDSAPTAGAIAKEIGITDDAKKVLTGRQLDEISDADFLNEVKNYNVYARVQPEHKVRIVKALQANGLISSMTGDGVNDSPSLKAADIGVGMGITGTDVSKGASDIVLSDDNFATIVSAVEEGRRIYDNIRKTIQFLLSTNLAEVLAIFAATIMGFPLFRPVHLLFINLITDSLPAIALGMEETEPGVMDRAPREGNESLFANGLGIDIIWQGIVIAALTLLSYFWVGSIAAHGYGYARGSEEWVATAMTAAFITLVFNEIAKGLATRSIDRSIFRLKGHNKLMFLAILVSAALSLALIYVPPLARAFRLVPLDFSEFAVAAGLGLAIFPIIEIYKEIRYRIRESHRPQGLPYAAAPTAG